MLALGALWAEPVRADEEVFAPMRAEMDRSFTGLRSGSFGPPYFIAYRLAGERNLEATASFGSLTSESRGESRELYVEVRVGDKTLDNVDMGYHGWHGSAGSDPGVLRQNLWNLTDRAYKSAVSGFLEKKARRATEFIPEPLDDFSVEASTSYSEAHSAWEPDAKELSHIVEGVSAVFRNFPAVYESNAVIRHSHGRRVLLTSEGTRLATKLQNVRGVLRLQIATRSSDGMKLVNHRSWVFNELSQLPDSLILRAEAERLARELLTAREAPLQAPMAVPVLLDPEVTGVLFHEALGHKLEGQRQRDPQQSQIFKDLIGVRIIPEFLSLLDDPTLAQFKGVPLSGHYAFDSEGVPAQRVVLVDKGVLKDFLMSRWPVKGRGHSNGHGRADGHRHPSGRMATLIVSADQRMSKDELKAKLMALARAAKKPYGFRLVGSFGGENPTSRDSAQTLEVRPRLLYRVDAHTGVETMVRGVKMVGTPLVVLNRIVAAGQDDELANGFVCGAESGSIPVSQIAPSVLLSDAEFQRLPEDRSLPPVLESPFHARD